MLGLAWQAGFPWAERECLFRDLPEVVQEKLLKTELNGSGHKREDECEDYGWVGGRNGIYRKKDCSQGSSKSIYHSVFGQPYF